MIDALSAGEFQDIQCTGDQVGRFVAIYLDHPGYLTVCEFEVYGSKHFLTLSKNDLLDFEIEKWCLTNKLLTIFDSFSVNV